MSPAEHVKLVLLPILIALAFLQAIFFFQSEIQAEERTPFTAVESAIEASYDLSDSAYVKVILSLTNQSSDKVLTSYELPNIWQFRQPRVIDPGGVPGSFYYSEGILKFDFSQNPLDPGRSLTIQIEGDSVAFISRPGVRTFRQDALNPFPAGENLRLHKTTINFPDSWPDYYLNLHAGEIQLQTLPERKLKQIQFEPKFMPLEVTWAGRHSLVVNYEYDLDHSAEFLAALPRRSAVQIPQYSPQDAVSRVFRDDRGNNFAALDPALLSAPGKLSHRYIVDINPQAQVLRKTELSVAARIPFPPPAGLSGWSDRPAGGGTTAQKIDAISQKLEAEFRIKSPAESSWEVSERGIDPSLVSKQSPGQGKLDYLEYLLLFNELLTKSGTKNTIVYLDQSYLGRAGQFVLEVCSEICDYYDLSARPQERTNRKLPPLGLQVIAFDGVDQLVFTMLRRNAGLLPSSVEIQKQSTGSAQANAISGTSSEESEVLIRLNIPREVRNFDNFTTQVAVDNRGQMPIFLEELRIAGTSFPIVDSSLAGLYEGVLPGQNREYRVDNVFLPLLFLGPSLQTDIEIGLVYQDDVGYEIYSRSQAINVAQNGGFWAGAILSIATLTLTLTTLYMIYKRNKFVIKGGYWKLRRGLNELLWRVNPINRIRNIT